MGAPASRLLADDGRDETGVVGGQGRRLLLAVALNHAAQADEAEHGKSMACQPLADDRRLAKGALPSSAAPWLTDRARRYRAGVRRAEVLGLSSAREPPATTACAPK